MVYYWRHDGIALMAACDIGHAAEMEPQTVMLMDLPTYDAYCGRQTSSDWGALTMAVVVQERRRRGSKPRIHGLAPPFRIPPTFASASRFGWTFRNLAAMTLTGAA